MQRDLSPRSDPPWRQLIRQAGGADAGVALAGFLWFASLLGGYFLLRPIRDEMGAAGGVQQLPWLFLGTLLATLAIAPIFAALVSKLPRGALVRGCLRGLALCLLGFWAALKGAPADWQPLIGRVFFIWLSVYNIFIVSLFWSVMADRCSTDQARRLYGLFAAGGTTGALLGSLVTATLVERIGTAALLLIAAALLELGLIAYGRLADPARQRDPLQARQAAEAVGGDLWGGLRAVFASPYLLGIAALMLLYAIGSTWLYFLQAELVADALPDREARTAWFARVDAWVNGLTLLLQLTVTAALWRRVGLWLLLAAVPLISLAGFAALAAAPTLAVLALVQISRRVAQFAFSSPAREALYVPLPREAKYKAKNLIDTVVFRSGDQAGAWSHTGLVALGLGSTGIALAALPLSAVSLALALALAAAHRRRTEPAAPAASPAPESSWN